MLKQPTHKKIGCIKLTFEALESILDMEPGSIQTIDTDNQTQSISIIHNDPGRRTWDLPSGYTVPVEIPQLHYIARMPPRKINKEEE
jgi:hypothetical protein